MKVVAASSLHSRRASHEGGFLLLCAHEITAMCAGLLHAAVEAPVGLGRATGTGWEGRRRMGFEFHSVDYFYEHYFNKVRIKVVIKVSGGGWGLEGETCGRAKFYYRTSSITSNWTKFMTPAFIPRGPSQCLQTIYWDTVVKQVNSIFFKRQQCGLREEPQK